MSKKVIMIGDGYTGKTSIVQRFAYRHKPGSYRPTIIDNFVASIKVAGMLREITIWDTSGQEDWAHIRKLAYLGSDLVILVFDLTDGNTLDNVLGTWLPEVKEFCPNAPIILAGNKNDLTRIVSTYEGNQMAKTIRAKHYLECSAFTDEGIDELFQKAGELMFYKKYCTIL